MSHHVIKGIGHVILKLIKKQAQQTIIHSATHFLEQHSPKKSIKVQHQKHIEAGKSQKSQICLQAKKPTVEKLNHKMESKQINQHQPNQEKKTKEQKHSDAWKEYQQFNTQKNIEVWKQWLQILRNSVLPEIKKIIDCQQLHFVKVYVRKATAGYVYWVHYQVNQLGNSKIGTLLLLEKDDSLQLIDVMQGHHLGIKIILH